MPKQTVLNEDAEIYKPRKNMTEKEKLKNMPFKERLPYLWEYYKFHAIVTIAVIGLLVYTIIQIFTPDIETQFYAAIINNSISEDLWSQYAEDFSSHLELNPKKERVEINPTYYFNGAPEYALSMQQVFTTRIAVKEIDVVIAPESLFKDYAYNGYFTKLTEQLPTDIYSSLTDYFYLSNTDEDLDSKDVYGIYLSDTDLFKKNAINDDPYILGIVANYQHKENTAEFVRYLFQQ